MFWAWHVQSDVRKNGFNREKMGGFKWHTLGWTTINMFFFVFFGSENIDGVIYLEIEVATMEDFRVGCKRVGIWQSRNGGSSFVNQKDIGFIFTKKRVLCHETWVSTLNMRGFIQQNLSLRLQKWGINLRPWEIETLVIRNTGFTVNDLTSLGDPVIKTCWGSEHLFRHSVVPFKPCWLIFLRAFFH